MPNDLAALLADLVSIDSVNPSLVPGGAGETEIAGFIARWAREAGLDVQVLEETARRPSVLARAPGRGGGRPLLGVLRDADAILFCQDAAAPTDALLAVMAELEVAGIDLPAALAAAKADEADAGAVERLKAAFPRLEVVAVSVLDDASLDRLRDLLWGLTGLVRVYLRDDEEPVALRPPVMVEDVADSIHHELGARCEGARVWGPSARFPGQRVGRTHELRDGDSVEILD
jgi:ribosome-interacting GTPase 1